jgi:hypothetical protein
MKQTITIIAMILFLAITINVQADDSIYSYAGMDAANTHINKSSYKMSGKGADMYMYTCSGCDCRNISFSVAETIYDDTPGSPIRNNEGYLYLDYYNDCTGSSRYANGYIELSTLNISNQLDSAYAEGFGVIYGWAYDAPDDTSPDYITEPVNIKVTWIDIGDVYTGRSRDTHSYTYPWGETHRYTYYNDNSSREASATGFLVGEATNIILVSSYADIFKNTEGFREIVKYPKNQSPKTQNYCLGNFDGDNDVDGSDAITFKADFGRSSIKNPCPTF